MHEVVHILAIVAAQTKELLYMSDTGGFGPLIKCLQAWPGLCRPSHSELCGPGSTTLL